MLPSITKTGEIESSLVGFGGLDDNPIKGLTIVLSVDRCLVQSLHGSTQVNTCDGPKIGMFMVVDITSEEEHCLSETRCA
jgi:hypothetical protein